MTDNEHDCYLSLANKILSLMGADNTILGTVGDGVISFKLAGTFHELGKSVLFIDGDMKEEIFLSKYRLGKDLKGVTSYLSGSEDARDLVCITNRNDLDVVFTGNVEGVSIKDIDPDRLRDFIDNYVDYDMVVVHSDESGKVASCCDRTVLLQQKADYSETGAQQKVKSLDKQGCYVLGVIINE
jgi:MinD-like ATPase involved in chromosome partitioning or flagellar assembly